MATLAPSVAASDLARQYGAGVAASRASRSGPARCGSKRGGKLDVQVYAVEGRTASALRFFCKGRQQAFGC